MRHDRGLAASPPVRYMLKVEGVCTPPLFLVPLMVSPVTELLFSYGTLRQPGVQRNIFGRELDGRPDAIVGYDLDYVTITDPRVIAASGSDRHPMLKPTDRADAAVEGTVYAVSESDLGPPTTYEVDDYERIAVPLRSGDHAWVYVFRELTRVNHHLTQLAEGRGGTGVLDGQLSVDPDLAMCVRRGLHGMARPSHADVRPLRVGERRGGLPRCNEAASGRVGRRVGVECLQVRGRTDHIVDVEAQRGIRADNVSDVWPRLSVRCSLADRD